MEIRGYREEDREGLGRLLTLAFGVSAVAEWDGYFDPARNRRLDPELVYVAGEDGASRGTATVLPLEIYVDGRAAPAGGVAAVATHPAYRRKRLAGELLRAVLYGMRERGFHLSMLQPFAHAFYRTHGWELAGDTVSYDLSPTQLSTSSEQSALRAYRKGDLPALRFLLEEEAARHPVCVRRGEVRWREILDGSGGRDHEAAVYEREGAVEGYLIYQSRGGEDERKTLEVAELVGRTPRVREALISFMAAYDPLEWRVEHQTSPGERLHPFLENSHVRAALKPSKMLRLVNVEGALAHLSRPVPEPLVLEVSDDTVPENAGLYTVGEGNVVRGAAAPERVTLDVRQLAQLYAGYLSAGQLYRRGLVAPGSRKALDLLHAIFPATDPWVFPLDRF